MPSFPKTVVIPKRPFLGRDKFFKFGTGNGLIENFDTG